MKRDQACSVPECDSRVIARGWCTKHYYRNSRGLKKCSIYDCSGTLIKWKLCSRHLRRLEEMGTTLVPYPRERGQGHVTINGYRVVARLMVHRKVMSEYLGRDLLPYETVHHINGDRLDNRLENLQLRSSDHGQGQVYKCSECGSDRIYPVELS